MIAVRRAVSAASVAALLLLLAAAQSASGQGTRLAVDVDTEANGPSQLGPLTPCLAVASGDDFEVDIIVADVQELLAWEIYFEYDPAILEVTQNNVRMFQEANPGSSVYDVSEVLPDSDGLYRLAAADTADPASPDSGSGVLARLTLRAIGPGISSASLTSRDLNGDGKMDLGPFLRNADAQAIGDEDGDTFFDGPISNARVAVDTPCGADSAAAISTGGTDDGGVRAVLILALVLGVTGALGLGSLLLIYRRRARAQPH